VYRQKYESVSEKTLPLLRDLNERIEKMARRVKTPVPPAGDETPDTLPVASRVDPRREPDEDPRREVPDDVVPTTKERKA
jgi:hypothetical protein